jgi:hypothetical protein
VRGLSQFKIDAIKQQASAHARALHGRTEDAVSMIEAFNDHLMALSVGQALCDPNDASKTYFQYPDDQVTRAFLVFPLRRMYEDLDRLMIQHSPVHQSIDDVDLARLVGLLTPEHLGATMPPSRGQQIRRLLTFILDELTEELSRHGRRNHPHSYWNEHRWRSVAHVLVLRESFGDYVAQDAGQLQKSKAVRR